MTSAIKLDRIDIKILVAMQENARITNQALAEVIGLSPSPCLERVRKLEKAGLMGPYLARVNLRKITPTVGVIANVTLGSHENPDFSAFESLVARIPEAVECFKVSGSFDYYLRFQCRDIETYHALSDRLIAEGPPGLRVNSQVILDKTKEFMGYPLDNLIT